tara:strand:- start:3742 stop:4284 length:543 start_codon:yes stop_codon:yes gene_type:complete
MIFVHNYYYELPEDIIYIISDFAALLYKELCANKIKNLFYNFIKKKKIAIELLSNLEIKNNYGYDNNNHNSLNNQLYSNNVIKYIDIIDDYNTKVINYCTRYLTGKEYVHYLQVFLRRIDNGIIIETEYHKHRLNYILDVINGKYDKNNYLNEIINKKIDNYNNNYKNLNILFEKFKCNL